MRTEEPLSIRLADYQPPAYTIEDIHLDVRVDADRTTVTAKSRVKRLGSDQAPLELDGENLELLSVAVDGDPLLPAAYALSDDKLIIPDVPAEFDLEISTAFSPRENTALSGIYLSKDRIFSQCEAEGFRRITYFLDRPDVLARYSVRIEADGSTFPILLSNGNLVDTGELDGERHWVLWRDPYPKPSYLFALVAGSFDLLEDTFTTMSGRRVTLRLYVDPGDAPRAEYALDSLKRAMRWDEEAFGREYDLDLFMIVAVRDFNFGAMENKGLNIFNSSLLLADPQTATDADFEAIESVVAHEYFHNWTGNRVTCRDWFQLCLKEGLTVFRDQEFSASQRGAALQRIKDVKRLRARQFPEDSGPLAHPVRPSQYVKIDNFYTATVYEKGAELIRMLREIIGADAFRRGMDLYFERCDGTAATVEDFVACFEKAAGRDLSSFMRWYEQSGTPRVRITGRYDPAAETFDLTARQETPPTPDQPRKRALPIPMRLALLGADGAPQPMRLDGENEPGPEERTLMLDDVEMSWRFVGLPHAPTISAFRGFSAPVIASSGDSLAARMRVAAFDSDWFNRWEAGQSVAREALAAASDPACADGAPSIDDAVGVLGAILRDTSLEPGFAALALTPPDEGEIAQTVDTVDPAAIRTARRTLLKKAAQKFELELRAIYDTHASTKPFSPDAASAGRRALRNVALRLLAELGPDAGGALAKAHFDAADNMTDAIAGLTALDASGSNAFDAGLAAFYDSWRDAPLVIDKWFAVQARTGRDDALERVRGLLAHPDYDDRTPNRVRAVLAVFAMMNLASFHRPDGAAYDLFVDQVLKIDARNPALAARLLGALEIWPKLEPARRAKAQAALERARDEATSKNLVEIASKALSAGET